MKMFCIWAWVIPFYYLFRKDLCVINMVTQILLLLLFNSRNSKIRSLSIHTHLLFIVLLLHIFPNMHFVQCNTVQVEIFSFWFFRDKTSWLRSSYRPLCFLVLIQVTLMLFCSIFDVLQAIQTSVRYKKCVYGEKKILSVNYKFNSYLSSFVFNQN